ncbi:hypothetical protein BGX30_015244, partial [Mortierella sp. GBA39]
MAIFKLDSYSSEDSSISTAKGSGSSPNTTNTANTPPTDDINVANLGILADVEIPVTNKDSTSSRYVQGDNIYIVGAFVVAGGYGSAYRARWGDDQYAIKAQKAGEEAYDAI